MNSEPAKAKKPSMGRAVVVFGVLFGLTVANVAAAAALGDQPSIWAWAILAFMGFGFAMAFWTYLHTRKLE